MSTGQDGSDHHDHDQRVTASRAGPRVIDAGEVGEQVRCFGWSEFIGVRELRQAQRIEDDGSAGTDLQHDYEAVGTT